MPRRSAILIQPRLLGPREAGGYSVVRIISACYIALFYASLDNKAQSLTGTVAVKRSRAKHCRPARFATGPWATGKSVHETGGEGACSARCQSNCVRTAAGREEGVGWQPNARPNLDRSAGCDSSPSTHGGASRLVSNDGALQQTRTCAAACPLEAFRSL